MDKSSRHLTCKPRFPGARSRLCVTRGCSRAAAESSGDRSRVACRAETATHLALHRSLLTPASAFTCFYPLGAARAGVTCDWAMAHKLPAAA